MRNRAPLVRGLGPRDHGSVEQRGEPGQGLTFGVLGPLEIAADSRTIPVHGQKQRALLALLLLRAGEAVSTDRLVDELWGKRPPPTARTSLRNLVAQLRTLLGPGVLVTKQPGYLLRLEPEQLDLARFERLVAEARRAEPELRAGLLREALALWRGPPLADLAYEPFAEAEIARLEELRLHALEERLEAELALGAGPELIPELEARVEEQPYRERLRGQLMLALYRAGRQAEALEVYRNARAALDELGIEPSEELRRLEKQILTQDTALAPTRRKINLPTQATPLVGRNEELADVLALVRANRLVTLTGAGGSGKTRLALATGRELVDDFADGVWFVSLASVTDTELVEPTIAHVLGARGDLNEFLRGKQMLLLLDNLEQLLPDVAETVARLEANVLATSRERLNLRAEHEYPVPTLPLEDAVELFTQRANQLEPRFQPDEHVQEIAHDLDGLPLALELAAARVKTLTPLQIVERLAQSLDLLTGGARDAPDRHQTLRATLEWSYQLLDQQEQTIFARLAVFVDGSTLDAAEQIADAQLDQLQSLVDKNLLRYSNERFWMLQTVREYANERLTETSDRERIEALHAAFFAARAEAFNADYECDGADVPKLLDESATEHGNFRAGLAWSLDHARPELALHLIADLYHYWLPRDHHLEGLRWAERGLLFVDAAPPDLCGRALYVAAELAFFSGDDERAAGFYTRALTLARERGDAPLVAWLLLKRAMTVTVRADVEAARHQIEESLQLYRGLGEHYSTAVALHYLGDVERDAGNTERAKELLVESIGLSRGHGAPVGRVGAILHSLGDVFLDERAFDDATSSYLEALHIAQEMGSHRDSAYCLGGLASAAAGAGAADTAARLWGAVESIESTIGVRMLSSERGRYERALGNLDPSLVEEGHALSVDEAVALALELRRE
jgi:predicted ATPase/DNA-binding SARP family transcriptional activator